MTKSRKTMNRQVSKVDTSKQWKFETVQFVPNGRSVKVHRSRTLTFHKPQGVTSFTSQWKVQKRTLSISTANRSSTLEKAQVVQTPASASGPIITDSGSQSPLLLNTQQRTNNKQQWTSDVANNNDEVTEKVESPYEHMFVILYGAEYRTRTSAQNRRQSQPVTRRFRIAISELVE